MLKSEKKLNWLCLQYKLAEIATAQTPEAPEYSYCKDLGKADWELSAAAA